VSSAQRTITRRRNAALDLDSWERQPRESAQAFAAFALYRDQMGRRSTAQAAATLDKSKRLIQRWSSRHQWVQRVRAYDRYLDGIARTKHQQAIVDFRRRAVHQSRGKAQSLMLPDMALSHKLSQPGALEELQNLSIHDLIALSARCAFALPNLLQAEALALGDVTDRPAEPTEPVDVMTRRIQDSDELRSLAATLIQRASEPLEDA
jgi:hypothetical protein